MFTRIVTTALFAGVSAGVVAALLQFWQVQPLLLHAELYEGGDLVHFGGALNSAHPELPGFDVMRDGLSVFFTALIYTGYALILTAAIALAADYGVSVTMKNGVLWGLAAFVSVHLAPAMGLPPEVPGAAAADVGPRQIWWFVTVAATAVGLGMMAFGRSALFLGLGVVLIALPHIIGAPEPDAFAGPTPPELAAHFAARALGVGLAVWVVLGVLVSYFWTAEDSQ